ncbi:MAG TPA: hypothetical protein VF891_05800, partial [Gaiellaceae bacterium]
RVGFDCGGGLIDPGERCVCARDAVLENVLGIDAVEAGTVAERFVALEPAREKPAVGGELGSSRVR